MASGPKTLLVQAVAHQRDLDHSHPLGVMSLAAYLRERAGCDVRIADMQFHCGRVRPIIEAARSFQPELVGISALSVDFPVAEELAA